MAKDGTLGTEFAEPFKPAKKRKFILLTLRVIPLKKRQKSVFCGINFCVLGANSQ